MRILVISDSHGRSKIIKDILLSKPDIKHVFFLGDVTRDIDEAKQDFPDREFHVVSGNCDIYCYYPETDIALINGVKILFAHGHKFSVKASKRPILSMAKEKGCPLVLYGHTHLPDISYEQGVYLVNPGSCAVPRGTKTTYAVIDISDKGIVPSIIEI